MKTIIAKTKMIAAALLINSAALVAQGPGDGPPPEHKQRFIEELQLSSEQQSQMEEVHQAFRTEMKKIRQSEGDWESKKAKIETLETERNAEVAEILSPEQYSKFEAHATKMKERRQHHRGMKGEGHKGGKCHADKEGTCEKGKGEHADRGRHHGKFHGKKMGPEHKAMRKEVRAFVEQNIFPVMKEQRLKLDEKMDAADRAKVEDLRAQLEALRPQMKEMRGHKHHKGQGRPELSEAQKAEMKKLHEQRRPIMEAAREIAKKYESELNALHAEVQPQAEEWKKELKAISQKHLGSDVPEGQGKHHLGPMGHKLRKHMRPAHFILMDPNAPMPSMRKAEKGQQTGPAQIGKVRNVQLYPNPSSGIQTLEYEVLQAGTVQIDLLSSEGAIIKNLYKGYKEAGKHSLKVDNQSLAANVYYFSILDASGKTTKQFVISK